MTAQELQAERALTRKVQWIWRKAYSKTDWWKRQEERNKEEALKLQALGLAVLIRSEEHRLNSSHATLSRMPSSA